jgi:hypothetical protein
VSSEPGTEEMLGAGPAAPGALAGIVRNKEELDVHAGDQGRREGAAPYAPRF